MLGSSPFYSNQSQLLPANKLGRRYRRPKQTVLEAEAFRLKNQQTSSTQFADVMKKKRAIHEEVIKKVQQQRARDEMPKEDTPEPAFEIRPGKKVSGSKRKSI
ncbi:hypothetical protein Leryth_005505 [Lithospermum erythrorhizon]|nr:hypothetical protein Leryth_005505 [Lithospermum erythrorhizon]